MTSVRVLSAIAALASILGFGFYFGRDGATASPAAKLSEAPPTATEAISPAPPPLPQAPPPENFELTVSLPVVDDTDTLITFEYLNIQHGVRAPKSVLQSGTKDLSTARVYLTPTIIIDKDELRQARPEKIGGDIDLYRVRVRASLINDAVRQKASDALKAAGYTGVNPASISLYPYRYIELFAKYPASAQSVRVASFPELSLGDKRLPAANPETALDFFLTGSESEIKAFIDEPRVIGQFFASGFTVKQNVVSFSLRNFLQLAYAQLLTGEAEWSNRLAFHKRTNALSGKLGGMLGVGGSGSTGNVTQTRASLVTRDQVKQLVTEYSKHLTGVTWTSFKSDRSQVVDAMVQQLLHQATVVEVEVVKNGNTFVVDPDRQKDFAPDVYKTLNAKLNDLAKLGTATQTGKVTYAGVTGESTKATPPFDATTDITWDTAGEITVPKALRVYQFNAMALHQLADVDIVETMAEPGAGTYFVPGRIVSRKVEEVRVPAVYRDVPFERTFKVAGGDLSYNLNPPADDDYGSKSGKLIEYQLGVWLERATDGRHVRIYGRFIGHESGRGANATKLGTNKQLLEEWKASDDGTIVDDFVTGGFRNTDEIWMPLTANHFGKHPWAPPADHVIRSIIFEGDGNGGDRAETSAEITVRFTTKVLMQPEQIKRVETLITE